MFRTIIFLFCLIIYTSVNCQITESTKAIINNVSFEMTNDYKVVITYDISNGNYSELFNIKFNAITGEGKHLDVKTFKGDIKNVSPGLGRKIIWDIGKDYIYLEESFFIEVEAEHINPKVIPYTTKRNAIIMSSLLPGLGSTRLAHNNIHLLKGITGLTSIAISLKYNSKGVIAYNNYESESDPTLRIDLINETNKNINRSRFFIASAITIWISDYINILLMENKTDTNNNNISFTPSLNIDKRNTQLAFKWNF